MKDGNTKEPLYIRPRGEFMISIFLKVKICLDLWTVIQILPNFIFAISKLEEDRIFILGKHLPC